MVSPMGCYDRRYLRSRANPRAVEEAFASACATLDLSREGRPLSHERAQEFRAIALKSIIEHAVAGEDDPRKLRARALERVYLSR